MLCRLSFCQENGKGRAVANAAFLQYVSNPLEYGGIYCRNLLFCDSPFYVALKTAGLSLFHFIPVRLPHDIHQMGDTEFQLVKGKASVFQRRFDILMVMWNARHNQIVSGAHTS